MGVVAACGARRVLGVGARTALRAGGAAESMRSRCAVVRERRCAGDAAQKGKCTQASFHVMAQAMTHKACALAGWRRVWDGVARGRCGGAGAPSCEKRVARLPDTIRRDAENAESAQKEEMHASEFLCHGPLDCARGKFSHDPQGICAGGMTERAGRRSAASAVFSFPRCPSRRHPEGRFCLKDLSGV